jgi:regulator of sigma E protease
MLLLIIGLLLFVGLVVVHEFGHFIMARRNGVDVEEFGIGFPPKIWSRKMRGGWLFSINLLPLGGFVRMKGEHDADDTKGSFGAASLGAKTKIMAAGVFLNLVTAIVLLMVLAWVGLPKLIDNQFTVKSDTKIIQNDVLVGEVEKGSPAAKAGLEVADRIVAIAPAGQPANSGIYKLQSADDLPRLTKKLAGQKVAIVISRHGQERQVATTLRSSQEVSASEKSASPKGYLGIYPGSYTLQRSTWSAPVVAVGLTAQFTKLTFEGLGKAVAGVGSMLAGAVTGNTQARQHGQTAASSQVSGPLGIFFILKEGGVFGYQFILLIIAVISLTLAIMNILPIPALDGGRLWLTLITHGIKKPLSQEKEELINGLGFLFLMMLIVLITIVDIQRRMHQ